MQFNRTFLEGGDIHPLFWEQDANTDITGDWISFRDYERAYVLMHKAGTEDVDDLGLQIIQGTDSSGTSGKAVLVSRCWYKTGTMTGQGLWTAVALTPSDFLAFGATASSGGVTYASTVNTRIVADVNTNAVSILVEILKTDLDQANGFKFFTAHLEGDNVNNSCLISGQVILQNCNYAGAIPPNPLA